MNVYDGLAISMSRIPEIVYSQSLAAFISTAIMYIVSWLLLEKIPNAIPYLLAFFMQIIISSIWATVAQKWYFMTFPPVRTIIVYDQREGVEDLVKEYGLDAKFGVKRVINVHECIDNDFKALHKMEAVFMCGIHSHDRNALLKYCVREGIDAYVIPRIGDVLMSSAKQVHMFHLPILRVHRYAPRIEYLIVKRFFDLVLSGIGLLVTSPIMLITAFFL